MYRAGRTAWGLVAVGAATAVGITTHDPGFIVITFIGALVVPRVLGLTPRRAGTGASVQMASAPAARAGAAVAPGPTARVPTPRHRPRRRNRSDPSIDGAAAARRPVPPLR